MKLLEAFCIYMENVATGIRMWLSIVGGMVGLIAILSLIFIKDITSQQLGGMSCWALGLTAAGLLFPPENAWFHWRIMAERENRRRDEQV